MKLEAEQEAECSVAVEAHKSRGETENLMK